MTKETRLAIYVTAFIMFEAALIATIDRPLSLYMHRLGKGDPSLINIFWTYTDLGKSCWYLWPAGIGTALCSALLWGAVRVSAEHRARIAQVGEKLLFLFACVAASGLLTDAIKPVLGRARPRELIEEGIYAFRPFSFHAVWNSMPSGHSTTAFALFFVLIGFWPRGRLIWLFLAVALAGSRVMVNAHFLSDVIFGAAMGYFISRAIEKAWEHDGMHHAIRRIFPIDRKNTMP